MTHAELWMGICNLAENFHISCSRLAKISGLNPTTFNPSKYILHNGRLRWLSMYSLSRVLDATGISLAEFATFLPSDTHERPRCPDFDKKPNTNLPPQQREL
ncbi:MAG: hypothetical protein IK122_02355 [Alphaproteobacteria bacterium]|nr:hypothetical protein [Alphaproteobacteria bacterium]